MNELFTNILILLATISIPLFLVISSIVFLIINNDDIKSGVKYTAWISNILIVVMITFFSVIILTRKYNSLTNLWKSDKSLFIPLIFAWLISIIMFILFILPSRMIRKVSDDKPNDKPDDKIKDTDSSQDIYKIINIIGIFIAILLLCVAIFVLYYFRKEVDYIIFVLIALPIIFFLGILIYIAVYYIRNFQKEEKKDKIDPKFNTKFPPPTGNNAMDYKLYQKMKKSLGDFYVDNNCDEKSCDNLYQQFMKTRDPKVVEALLKDMGKKDGKLQNTPALINQAIFLVYQLIQCKVQSAGLQIDLSEFGTWEWWERNILMAGGQKKDGKTTDVGGTFFTTTDPIQRYIYIIAALVCLIFLLYNLGKYGINIKKILGLGIGSIPSQFAKSIIILGIVVAVVVFNVYYMWLIPQLAIIGIILQKYILGTSLTENLGATIIKGIILVAILFASFYDTTYTFGDIRKELEKEEGKKITNIAATYNKPVWYIFGMVLAVFLQNGIESLTGAVDNYGESEWSLLLMPIARYLIEFVNRGSVPYSAVSVKNVIN